MTTSARDAMWLLFILIVIGVIWSFQREGGALGIFPGSGPKLSPEEKTETVRTPEGGRTIKEVSKTPDISINAVSVKTVKAEEEYIIIKNVGDQKIDITNLKFKNKNNESESVGTDENGAVIFLNPNEQAVISSGKSPLSRNFKINDCSGYFSQFNKFIPPIPQKCPAIKNLSEAKKLDDVCTAYLSKIKTCAMPTSLPTNLVSSCQQLIQTHANYLGCVADYKNEKDFEKKEWRVFFNRTSEFWASKNETIKIVDSADKIIAEKSY